MKTVSAAHSSVALAPSAHASYAGWSALASGGSAIAMIAALGLTPLLDESVGDALKLALALVLFVGMIPVAVWLVRGAPVRLAGVAVAAGVVGVAGVLGSVAKALLVMPHALPMVPAQILETSALGAIGLWLLVADPLALRSRSLSRALAILGIVAGLGWLLPAMIMMIMWLDLTLGDLGGLTPVLEAIRTFGGMLAELLYTIWALWLGVRLVRR